MIDARLTSKMHGDTISRQEQQYRDPCRDCHTENSRLRRSNRMRKDLIEGQDERITRDRKYIAEVEAERDKLNARIWDAETMLIKIREITDEIERAKGERISADTWSTRETAINNITAIVTDIPIGTLMQENGVAVEICDLRETNERNRAIIIQYESIIGIDKENILEQTDIIDGFRAALNNQGRTLNNKIIKQKVTIEELETANEAGRSVYQRLYHQNHNLVAMMEVRDETIKQQKATIKNLEHDLIGITEIING